MADSGDDTNSLYLCEQAVQLAVQYFDDSEPQRILLMLPDGPQQLQRQASASGERYANERLLWWAKGERAMAFIVDDQGVESDLYKDCQLLP